MRRFFIVFVLAAGFVAPALAADMTVSRHVSAVVPGVALPFPRTARAAAVWDERTCWTQCGAHTAWAMADCLGRDAQGLCLDRTDHSDRMCQRACRTSGGPYLPDIFDF
jgi:hypothetical protein